MMDINEFDRHDLSAITSIAHFNFCVLIIYSYNSLKAIEDIEYISRISSKQGAIQYKYDKTTLSANINFSPTSVAFSTCEIDLSDNVNHLRP